MAPIRLLTLLIFLIAFRFFSQTTNPVMHILNASALRCAGPENQQQGNPAAFVTKNNKGQQVYLLIPLRVTTLGLLGYAHYYNAFKVAFYHDVQALFSGVVGQISTAHALGFSPGPHFQLGVGFQIQMLAQPSFYGAAFAYSVRLGGQYTLTKTETVGFTIEGIGSRGGQSIGVEYMRSLSGDVQFSIGTCWALPFNPAWYLSIRQQFKTGKIQLVYGLFPQHYRCTLQWQKWSKFDFVLAQGWNAGLGSTFQFGIKF